MDPIKVLAQQRAAATADNLHATGADETAASRGESAYVWEEADSYRALVVEGLGTKNLVDARYQSTCTFVSATYILVPRTVSSMDHLR